MKIQISVVAKVLFVGCMLAQSLAAPLQEEGDARAVLQTIRMLLAAEKHDRAELQQAGNSTNTTSAGECMVEDSDKVDCGYLGISQTECANAGCCWKESNASDVPYCFETIETKAQCQTDDRVECGYFGIQGIECARMGCCYSPTRVSGQPWCYHEKAIGPQCQTDPAQRVECGYYGITAQQCKADGCCWSPTNVAGAPWCFTKSSAPSQVSTSAYFGNQQFRRG